MPKTALPAALLPIEPRALPVCDHTEGSVVHDFVGTYLMVIANRLSKGASSHYRRLWNIGMSEWRTIIAIDTAQDLIIREVAAKADLDEAAVSRSITVLRERGLVTLVQTRRRGRAAVVSLTAEGLTLCEELRRSAMERQVRLLSLMEEGEAEMLLALLKKLDAGIELMDGADSSKTTL